MTYEHQKKQRNTLLKQKAKLMAARQGSTGAKVLFDVDAGPDTFVTGGGIPGRNKG